jgi:hypothetical protein
MLELLGEAANITFLVIELLTVCTDESEVDDDGCARGIVIDSVVEDGDDVPEEAIAEGKDTASIQSLTLLVDVDEVSLIEVN